MTGPCLVPELFSAVLQGVPADRLPDLQAKIDAANRRAAKLGTSPLAVYEHRRRIERAIVGYFNGRAIHRLTELVDVGILGPRPCVAGFRFVARLEHTEAGNIVTGDGDPAFDAVRAQYREAKPRCDHCRTARKRLDTFLLVGPDGTPRQVGRNCLRDYLGGDVSSALALFDLLRVPDVSDGGEGGEGGGGRGFDGFLDLERFVACAAASIRAHGFHKSRGTDRPTVGQACFLAGPPPRGEQSRVRAWISGQPTEADFETARATIEFVRASDDPGDYMSNLRVACCLDYVRSRNTGLVASAPQAYLRHLGEVREREARPPSEYVGTPGERLAFDAVVVRKIAIETDRGTLRIIVLRTDAGAILTWKTTACFSPQQGDRVTGKGTIKAHEVYRGERQTVLSRVAVHDPAAKAA